MIYENGEDIGYVDSPGWWSDPSNPNAFRISKIDEDYPAEYFKDDHVSQAIVANYCNNVIREYEMFAGERLKSIIEFGSGGGWFTKEFRTRGYEIIGYEASEAGIKKCHSHRLYSVNKRDFRRIIENNGTYFQIALCTEVAGHIEPPFSAILVQNLVNHADVIWWSSEYPNANRPHLHHPNEQPYQYWINLFDFYGYSPILLSDDIFNACERRGRYMFYNRYKFRDYENAR